MVESRDIKISIKKGKPGKECRKIAQGSQRTGYETTEGASRWLSDQNDNNDNNDHIYNQEVFRWTSNTMNK